MLGTALGDIIGKAFPDSAAARFLSAGITVGTTSPWDLDLRVVTLTGGVVLRLTIPGAAGAIAALVIFFRRVCPVAADAAALDRARLRVATALRAPAPRGPGVHGAPRGHRRDAAPGRAARSPGASSGALQGAG